MPRSGPSAHDRSHSAMKVSRLLGASRLGSEGNAKRPNKPAPGSGSKSQLRSLAVLADPSPLKHEPRVDVVRGEVTQAQARHR